MVASRVEVVSPQGRRRRGLALALGRHRHLHRRAGCRSTKRRARHRGGAQSARRRQGLTPSRRRLERIVAAYSDHIARADHARRSATAAEKTLANGSAIWLRSRRPSVSARGVRGILSAMSAGHLRRSGADHPLPRRGPARIFGAPLSSRRCGPSISSIPDRKGRIKLYVRRVFITDDADSCPPGCASSAASSIREDLPLNVSREMLQNNPLLAAIGKAVTNRVLAELEKLAADDKRTSSKIWEAFGPVIKEGLYEDAGAARRSSTRSPASARRRRQLAQPHRLCRGDDGPTRPPSTTSLGRGARRSWRARSSKVSAPAASRCCCSPIRSTPSGCARRSASTASRSSR